jgi:DNA-binding transcriptional regulator YdaS (Cro superfamily)
MNRELKAAIIRRYGTQYHFAAALGIQESIVSCVVRGNRDLSAEDQRKWAKLLGVDDPGKLFGGTSHV